MSISFVGKSRSTLKYIVTVFNLMQVICVVDFV